MRVIPLVVLLGSCLAVPAQAAESWLQRLAQADRQSFQGTFIYERNGSFSTHGVWHRGGEEGVTERLLQLDGPEQEVLRVNGKPQCMSGVFAEQAIDAKWPARELDAKQLEQRYDLRVLGHSRVAGRAATVLALIPRDQHRYAFELHLDDETALPLKSLLISEKGQLLERFQFVNFEPVDQFAAADLQPSDACKSVNFTQLAELPASWQAGWVPPGFELDQALRRGSPSSEEQVACLLYGDGLARFTVFLEPLRGDVLAEDARSQLGPTAVVSRRMSTADGDMMVTVVGEIPLGTAERVALSMQTAATVESTAQ
ncbi:MucB/RseB C-terminal domain-containing protein [Pseudomonas subflava]|uniref:MucB/RseB C-terminal domain-containing protein n=1 Tax=Pseudomonas subflava TaxID=2952933 RepID=UPI002079AEC3|nr:MucB/RseB C-terminal domain-containing protein [Pseudomonas subflava]